MLFLSFTDPHGIDRIVKVVTTFRDENKRQFAVIPCRRGTYDVEPPFCVIEIDRNGTRLSKAVTA